MAYNEASFFEAMGQSGFPMPSFPDPNEIRQKSKQLSMEIFDNCFLLHAILDRHEATIQKRWRKKTTDQPRKFLLAAWPNMSKGHRPDFEAFMKESPQQRAKDTSFKEAFIRGHNLPDAFAFADADAAHVGHVTQAIKPAFLNSYTMVFAERKTPQSYGKLIAWDDDPDAFGWMNSGISKQPGESLTVLEIQKRVWSFLVDCCLHILHEIPKANIVSERYNVQPEPPMVLGRDEVGFPSLLVVAAEAPYQVPAALDLARLEMLVASRRSSAKDHYWALKEDPSYFAQVMLEFKEHRQELIPDTNGKSHPTLDEPYQSLFWNRILGEAQNKISSLEALPQEYLRSLQSFLSSLEQLSKGPTEMLKRGVPASPPLRSQFVRESQRAGTTKMQVHSRPVKDSKKTIGRLLWLFSTLWNSDQLYLFGLHNLVDELERLTQSEPEVKHSLSSWTADRIFDLSLIAECIHNVNHYYPWVESIRVGAAEGGKSVKAEYIAFSNDLTPLLKTNFEATDLADLGTPGGRRFFYPADKRRTKENTQALRSAEDNLNAFWSAVDSHLISKCKGSYDMVRDLLSKDRVLQRTPEWVEPRKEAHKSANAIQTIDQPLSQLYIDLESRTERTISDSTSVPPTAKVKPKTRKAPITSEASFQPSLAAPPSPPLVSPISVDRRALKAFSTLFHDPSASSQPGEIAWTDFLHAMLSAGLSPQKLYGSVWQFSPQQGRGRSIQFHEPHPAGKIPFLVARRHGRRLNRAYGWGGGCFVLHEKVEGVEKQDNDA
ncbi:MAG: hypothetical protein Q9160_006366 [Pyrenula sp. 1 TL-2023]